MRQPLSSAVVLVLAVTVPLAAQDEVAPPPPPFQFQASLGFVNVSGNTEITTLNVGEKVIWTMTPVILTQTFSTIYGKTDGETSASTWTGNVRMDYALSERVSLFVLGGYERNRFAGISSRFEETAGVGFRVLKGPRDILETEAGISFIQERTTTDLDDTFSAGRAAALFKHYFNKSSYFQQTAEALPNLEDSDDLRLNSETSLIAPLSGNIALKLAYAIRFDNQPQPGFEKTDRSFTSGIQVVF